MERFLYDESGATREWVSSTAMFLTAVTVILVMAGSEEVNLSARVVQGKAQLAQTWITIRSVVGL
ncbi:hypothetical protein JQC91_12145 [Jannaschia sp. Os4]|uniref:hypothetical protein n=1 Tax=Jannaschia sp. Os4 TaxID=2807617 RepID=UPI00193A2F33|nr:hypothetical protein [Jannaschia sp. Os4]MBM2577049.1 hypothetical protein [Jannaschia sp. Os4]